MRNLSCALVYAAFAALTATAAPPAAPKTNQSTTVPKKIADKLNPVIERIKATKPRVAQKTAGEFVNTRNVASDVKARFSISDYADKPYKAVVSWVSNHQETRIYSSPEKADQADEWLAEGEIAGSSNKAKRLPDRCTATWFFVDGKWQLEKIEWLADYGNRALPPGFKPPRASSTAKGDTTDWQDVLSGTDAVKAR